MGKNNKGQIFYFLMVGVERLLKIGLTISNGVSRMAKHVGVKLPDDLIKVLKSGKTVGILATFSEKDYLIQHL